MDEFQFEEVLEIVAMEKADNFGNISVIAQNQAFVPTSFTWVVTADRSKSLRIGQTFDVGVRFPK